VRTLRRQTGSQQAGGERADEHPAPWIFGFVERVHAKNGVRVELRGRAEFYSDPNFLKENGLLPDPGAPGRHIDDWETLVLDVAASRIDRKETTARLRKLLRRRARAR
jgi:hypothetical protein